MMYLVMRREGEGEREGGEGEGTYISVPDLKEVLGTRVTCLEKSR